MEMFLLKKENPLKRMVVDGGYCAIFRTIACIGDSLSSGEFDFIDPNGKGSGVDLYEYSWGQFLARDTGAKVYNFSQGGMTAKDYVQWYANDNGFWDNDKLAQAYIIALGVNDIINRNMEVGSVDDIEKDDCQSGKETFARYYGRIIQKIKQIQPRAKIFLVSMPKDVPENNEKKRRHRDLLQEMTLFFDKTYLIDLFEDAPEYDVEFKKTFFSGGHMAPTGYLLTAKMIESYIDYIIRSRPEEFNEVGFIGTDLSYKKQLALL